jgi:multidrug efflux pump subunit AcrB
MQDVLSDVRSAVARAVLPTDAKSPNIAEIETDTNRAFSIFLYNTEGNDSLDALFERARELKKSLEQTPGVNTVSISAG